MKWRIFRGIDDSVYPLFLVSEWRTERDAGLEGIVKAVEELDWPRENELLLEYRDSRIDDYNAYWKEITGKTDDETMVVPMDLESIRNYIGENRLSDDFMAFGEARPRLATDFMEAEEMRDYLVESNLAPLMERLNCQCLCVYRDFDRHGIMMTK